MEGAPGEQPWAPEQARPAGALQAARVSDEWNICGLSALCRGRGRRPPAPFLTHCASEELPETYLTLRPVATCGHAECLQLATRILPGKCHISSQRFSKPCLCRLADLFRKLSLDRVS